MGKLVLDPDTVAKLNGLTEQAELYDERGNLLAYLTPIDAGLGGVDLPGPDPFSDEQVEQALRTPDPGRPLGDILRDLRGR